MLFPITRKMYTSMDVTFFENQSFFTKTQIHGENMRNFKPLEVDYFSTIPTIPITTEISSSTINELAIPESNQPRIPSQNRTPIVYTRRREATVHNQECQPPELDSLSLNTTEEDVTSMEPLIDDLILPIDRRKGVRSCTNHPIEKYVAYCRFHPSY